MMKVPLFSKSTFPCPHFEMLGKNDISRCPASAPSISPLFLTQDSRFSISPIFKTPGWEHFTLVPIITRQSNFLTLWERGLQLNHLTHKKNTERNRIVLFLSMKEKQNLLFAEEAIGPPRLPPLPPPSLLK